MLAGYYHSPLGNMQNFEPSKIGQNARNRGNWDLKPNKRRVFSITGKFWT